MNANHKFDKKKKLTKREETQNYQICIVNVNANAAFWSWTFEREREREKLIIN